MSQSRRDFLRMSALFVTGAALYSQQSCSSPAKGADKLGIQLYSVRDDMSKDPLGTLQQLAEMGYINVEHANYVDRKFYGFDAETFKKHLEELGLRMPSGHVDFGLEYWDEANDDFTDKWKNTIEDALTAGQEYLITPWMTEEIREDYDKLMKTMDLFNRCGAYCKEKGIKFGYHNHDFEYSTRLKGEMLYDIIMRSTDQDLIVHQLDMGNMYDGGANPKDIIEAYPGRFEMMHVKDVIKSDEGEEMTGNASAGKYESTVLGKGIAHVEDMLTLVKKTNDIKYFIVEQESYQDLTPLESVQEDYTMMKKWGY